VRVCANPSHGPDPPSSSFPFLPPSLLPTGQVVKDWPNCKAFIVFCLGSSGSYLAESSGKIVRGQADEEEGREGRRVGYGV